MKKYKIGLIALLLTELMIILADWFLFNIPSVVCAVLVIGSVAGYVVMFAKGMFKKFGKIILGAAVLICTLISVFFAYCYPYWNSTVFKNSKPNSAIYSETITRDEAVNDLDTMIQYLEKTHPAFRGGLPEIIREAYKEAKITLNGREEIPRYEFQRMLENIVAVLHDAHTYITPDYETYHYMSRIYEHNQKNERIAAINGIPIEELLREKSLYYSFEHPARGMQLIKGDVSTIEGLSYLGFDTDAGVTYLFIDDEDHITEDTAYTADYLTYNEIAQMYGIESENTPFYSYTIDEQKSLAVFVLTGCKDTEGYRSCLKSMFEEVKEKGIKNVALDIRDNTGGTPLVAKEFFKYLDADEISYDGKMYRFGFLMIHSAVKSEKNDKYSDLIFDGNFYVLTSNSTFSAAMNIAEYVKDNKLGTIIGEEPANDPNGYSYSVGFRLPKSGFMLEVSHIKSERVDSDCEEKYIVPDIECDSENALEKLYSMLE